MAQESATRRVVIAAATALATGLVGLLIAYVHYRVGITKEGSPVHPGGPEASKPDGGQQPGKEPLSAAKARVVKSPLDVLSAVADDLLKVPPEDRPQWRYLTLTHLHNNRRLADGDLQAWREALGHLAGYLSPPGTVVAFQPLDKEQTVYAVNLKELGWDAEKHWGQVLRAYPYGLAYDTSADAQLRAAYQQVRKLSDSDRPCVRADWFLAAVVRPPLGGAGGALPVPMREVPDPVRALAQSYDGQELDLESAAAELALADPGRLEKVIRDEPRLRHKFKLDPLTQGGKVRRTVWESREFGSSPFQVVSEELNLGTPSN